MIGWTLFGLSLAAHLALALRRSSEFERWDDLRNDLETDNQNLRVRCRELREQHAAMAKKILAVQRAVEEMP